MRITIQQSRRISVQGRPVVHPGTPAGHVAVEVFGRVYTGAPLSGERAVPGLSMPVPAPGSASEALLERV